MITVNQLLVEAIDWDGTPYHEQARLKHVGCDCVGYFVGMGRNLGITIVDHTDYPKEPSGEELAQALRAHCRPLERVSEALQAPLGSILAFKIRADEGPHHLALRTSRGMMHAWCRKGKGGGRVIDHPLSKVWQARFHSAWWHKDVAWQH